jgi:hypothetical protein
MNKVILINILMNFVFTVVFIFINNWALQNNFEETFVSLAVIYGAVSLITNALFVAKFLKK